MEEQRPDYQTFKVPVDDLSCSICRDVFKEPITLRCGHTFCRSCIYDSIINLAKEQGLPPLPICFNCSSVIWRPLSVFTPNIVVTNLINRFKFTPKKTSKHKAIPNLANPYHILIHCQKPKLHPMPYCINQLFFSSKIPDAVMDQSVSTYVILRFDSNNKNFDGLAAKCLKMQQVDEEKSLFKGNFIGVEFVKIIGEKKIKVPSKDINEEDAYEQTLCVTQPVHAKNPLRLQNFEFFFHFYDMLNNPHYLRQINQLIDLSVFQNRNNPEAMIYCAIRVLRLPDETQDRLLQQFDDDARVTIIDDWLVGKANSILEQVMRVTTPGKFNSGIVFVIIILIIGLHLLR